MSKKKVVIKQGHCPKCNSDDLSYDEPGWRNGAIDFPFICNSCKLEGTENYTMEFVGYETSDYEFYDVGSEVEVDD